MVLTKAEIVGRICGKDRISNPETFNVVQATFEVIKASLERGEKVKIKNFGNFAVRTKRRRGRNPNRRRISHLRPEGFNLCSRPSHEESCQ